MAKVYHADHCPITGKSGKDFMVYPMELSDDFKIEGIYWVYPEIPERLLIVSGDLFDNSELWSEKRREIEYLIFNEIWPKGLDMMTTPKLKALISSSKIPITPLEKLKELLFLVKSESNYLGQLVYIQQRFTFSSFIIKKTGMVNDNELFNITQAAINSGYLKDAGSSKSDLPVILTIQGWEEASKIGEEKFSKSAFVAMSFDSKMIQIYNDWIEPAIKESGFEPYIVLDQHPGSDVTINDAILAGIKKAKFTIADFTHHKSGVYFEAGYALGRGQKVIYTCQEDHIGTAHFDTRNYQHLVWKDGADLKKKLMDKIEVFIKS